MRLPQRPQNAVCAATVFGLLTVTCSGLCSDASDPFPQPLGLHPGGPQQPSPYLVAPSVPSEPFREDMYSETHQSSSFPDYELRVNAQVRMLRFVNSGSTIFPEEVLEGARNQLAFRVEPIVLAGASAAIRFVDTEGFSWVGLRGSYETDRVYRSGGTIDTDGNFARELGMDSRYADIVNGALQSYGLTFEAERAVFTNGRVQVQDVATGIPYADASLVFRRTRFEMWYEFAPKLPSLGVPAQSWLARPWSDYAHDEYPIHMRLTILHYQTNLPRIVYLTQLESDCETCDTREVVVVETPPQDVALAVTAFGTMLAVPLLARKSGHLAVDVALLLGSASGTFHLPGDLSQPDSLENRRKIESSGLGVVGRAGIDGEVRIVEGDLEMYFGASIRGEQYAATLPVEGDPEGSITFADGFFSAHAFMSLRYNGVF
jgi:hypothetical protein